MEPLFGKHINSFLIAQQKKRKLHRLVQCLAAVVVFATTYMLILPAITMTNDTVCGIEEHVHEESCYEKTEVIKELSCSSEELEIHKHTESCYDSEQILICGYADYLVHEHDETCKDSDDNLICTLEEVKEHEHEESCYTTSEYLACGVAEAAAHTHSENCYTKEKGDLSCIESVHVHIEECYNEAGDVVCSLAEHSHGDSCYQWNDVLVCSVQETQGHSHTADCYKTDIELTCTEKEAIVHEEHTEECYEDEVLVCELLITKEHKHSDTCVETSGEEEVVLICEKEEHTHNESCYPEEEAENEDENLNSEESQQADAESQEAQTMLLGLEDEETMADEGTMPLAEDDVDTEINFGQWITAVSLQHKKSDSLEWINVNEGQVQEGDDLRFNIQYVVPAGALAESNTITYQIPNGVKPTQAESGIVYDENNNAVGTYTIDLDGKITIVFNNEYVQKNVGNEETEGTAISGYIAFESSVKNVAADDKGDVKLDFNNKVSVDIHITDRTLDNSDLQVAKTASNVNNDNGTVDYTVTVTSEHGTKTDVIVTDIMTGGIKLNGAVTVKDKNGNVLQNITLPESGADNFSLTLPAMEAGDVYTITYSGKVDGTINGDKSVNNKVTTESTNENDAKLKDETDVDTTFTKNLISKTGTQDGDKIRWTITINGAKQNISGYELSDVLNGTEFTENVTLTDSSGNSQSVKLPYTFPDNSTDTYVVTYETDTDRQIGSSTVGNTAALTPPNGEGVTGEGTINVGEYNPLEKNAVGLEVNADGTTATINWTVKISASEGTIPATWTYTDELWNKQWFTTEQLRAIKAALDQSLAQNNLSLNYTIKANELSGEDGVGQEVAYENIKENGKYKVYKIVFTSPLEKGKEISYSYTSTAPLKDGTETLTFRNNANINGKVSDHGEIQYKPFVRKYDFKAANGENSNGTTHHDYHDSNLKDSSQYGVMQWGITVTVPEYHKDGFIISEELPNGVTLVNLEILADGVFGATNFKFDDSGNGVATHGGYTIKAVKTGNTIDIEIPMSLAKNASLKEIRFVVKAKISDEYQWRENASGMPEGTFANTVKIKTPNGNSILAQDTQIQVVTKDENYDVAEKSHGTVENNVVPYTVSVNPHGKDLIEGSDTITFVDTLKFTSNADSPFSANLVQGTVKVYKVLDNDSREELNIEEYPYTYEQNVDGNNHTNTLTITIPDETPLIIEYKYRMSGKIGKEKTFKNTADLVSITSDTSRGEDSVKVQIQSNNAGASLEGVTVYKVDSENNNIMLAGAKFKLSKWNGTDYVKVSENLTTGTNGTIKLTDIVDNTAYMLTETTAPDGYIKSSEPYYFYISNSDTATYPLTLPDNFTGHKLLGGDVIFIANVKNSTSIKITKNWKNADGNAAERADGSVKIQVWQKLGDSENLYYKDPEKPEDLFEVEGPEWTLEITDLPKDAYNESGEKIGTYTYYVKEVNADQYTVTYENNDGIESGDIVITNQEKESFLLPETGGSGSIVYTAGSVLLLMAAALLYIKMKNQMKGGRISTGN